MDMPVTERRLNIGFINEHLDKLREIRNERQIVTADKPLKSRPGDTTADQSPTYVSKIKSKK